MHTDFSSPNVKCPWQSGIHPPPPLNSFLHGNIKRTGREGTAAEQAAVVREGEAGY